MCVLNYIYSTLQRLQVQTFVLNLRGIKYDVDIIQNKVNHTKIVIFWYKLILFHIAAIYKYNFWLSGYMVYSTILILLGI